MNNLQSAQLAAYPVEDNYPNRKRELAIAHFQTSSKNSSFRKYWMVDFKNL